MGEVGEEFGREMGGTEGRTYNVLVFFGVVGDFGDGERAGDGLFVGGFACGYEELVPIHIRLIEEQAEEEIPVNRFAHLHTLAAA